MWPLSIYLLRVFESQKMYDLEGYKALKRNNPVGKY